MKVCASVAYKSLVHGLGHLFQFSHRRGYRNLGKRPAGRESAFDTVVAWNTGELDRGDGNTIDVLLTLQLRHGPDHCRPRCRSWSPRQLERFHVVTERAARGWKDRKGDRSIRQRLNTRNSPNTTPKDGWGRGVALLASAARRSAASNSFVGVHERRTVEVTPEQVRKS